MWLRRDIAIPVIGKRWLSQAGWSTFLCFKWFLLYSWVVFCLIGVFLFLVLRLFQLSWGCKVRLLAVLHTAFPDGAVLCCRLLVILCPEPHPYQPLVLVGVVNRHQMVTHKSVNCSWTSRAWGHLLGQLLSILEELEQAEGIVRDYLP